MLSCYKKDVDRLVVVESVHLVVVASILAMEEQAAVGLLNGKCHCD